MRLTFLVGLIVAATLIAFGAPPALVAVGAVVLAVYDALRLRRRQREERRW